MGSIFGKAKKGFGMLKKSKDSKFLKRRKNVGGMKEEDFWSKWKRENKPEPARPMTPAAKQKIATDWVNIRKRTKGAWKKKKLEKAIGGIVKKLRPGGYGPTNPPSEDKPKAGPGARASRKSGPHDRHPPKTKRRMGRPGGIKREGMGKPGGIKGMGPQGETKRRRDNG